MEVIPAIDLRGGKCVRLYQGDYAQETVYSDDPLETALHWVDMGATRLHIVDLDGARDGARRTCSRRAHIICCGRSRSSGRRYPRPQYRACGD